MADQNVNPGQGAPVHEAQEAADKGLGAPIPAAKGGKPAKGSPLAPDIENPGPKVENGSDQSPSKSKLWIIIVAFLLGAVIIGIGIWWCRGNAAAALEAEQLNAAQALEAEQLTAAQALEAEQLIVAQALEAEQLNAVKELEAELKEMLRSQTENKAESDKLWMLDTQNRTDAAYGRAEYTDDMQENVRAKIKAEIKKIKTKSPVPFFNDILKQFKELTNDDAKNLAISTRQMNLTKLVGDLKLLQDLLPDDNTTPPSTKDVTKGGCAALIDELQRTHDDLWNSF